MKIAGGFYRRTTVYRSRRRLLVSLHRKEEVGESNDGYEEKHCYAPHFVLRVDNRFYWR
jgi:hypothetical protein